MQPVGWIGNGLNRAVVFDLALCSGSTLILVVGFVHAGPVFSVAGNVQTGLVEKLGVVGESRDSECLIKDVGCTACDSIV